MDSFDPRAPTIVHGGLTMLGVITNRALGTPGPKGLSESQIAFYRAGHAHAGVLTLLALFLQIALDHAAIPSPLVWPARVRGYRRLDSGVRWIFRSRLPALTAFLLYVGAALVAVTTLTVGIGLIR